MKKFKVVLRLYLGEYEKVATHWIDADNDIEAAHAAMCDEFHNEPPERKGFDIDEHYDDGDVGSYGVDSCRQLNYIPRRLWCEIQSYF